MPLEKIPFSAWIGGENEYLYDKSIKFILLTKWKVKNVLVPTSVVIIFVFVKQIHEEYCCQMF